MISSFGNTPCIMCCRLALCVVDCIMCSRLILCIPVRFLVAPLMIIYDFNCQLMEYATSPRISLSLSIFHSQSLYQSSYVCPLDSISLPHILSLSLSPLHQSPSLSPPSLKLPLSIFHSQSLYQSSYVCALDSLSPSHTLSLPLTTPSRERDRERER
jgi:hypothetical protein